MNCKCVPEIKRADGTCIFCEGRTSGWISVEERLPDKATWDKDNPVLVVCFEDQIRVGEITETNNWMDIWSGEYLEDVTHWKPLPAKPENDNSTGSR